MKTLKKIAAVALCLTLTMVSSMSVFAADSGNWSFAATPAYTEVPKTITLDYSSNGYTAKITSKSGGSTMNAVVIKGNAYSPKEVAKISEVGVNANIDKPKYNYAKVTFTVTLQWQSGQTAYNNGTIARK